MRADDGARLMTLVISTECANPPTLVGGSLACISSPQHYEIDASGHMEPGFSGHDMAIIQ